MSSKFRYEVTPAQAKQMPPPLDLRGMRESEYVAQEVNDARVGAETLEGPVARLGAENELPISIKQHSEGARRLFRWKDL